MQRLKKTAIGAGVLLSFAYSLNTTQAADLADSVPSVSVSPSEQPNLVHISIRNNSDEVIGLPSHMIPGNSLAANIFSVVSSSGEDIRYKGAIAEFENEPIVSLEPHSAIEIDVDLRKTYNLPTAGTYTVSYHAYGPGRADAEDLMSELISTAPAKVHLDLPDDCGEGCGPGQDGKDIFVAFQGCSDSQQQMWNNDIIPWAQLLTTISYLNLEFGNGLSINDYWFGTDPTFEQAAYSRMKGLYKQLLETPNDIQYSCQCPTEYEQNGVLGFVIANTSNEIYTCSDFWKLDTSANSTKFAYQRGKAAVVIHEMTHFANHGGTEDYVYGYNKVHTFAQNHPDMAAKNAANYEFHAQNNPCVNCVKSP